MGIITNKRRIGGKRAKFAGANFESQFANLCGIQSVACVRIPDSCRQLGPHKLMRVRSPFDYIIAYKGKTAVLDLKSVGDGNFTHSKITLHQLSALNELSVGAISGYVVGFTLAVYFVPVVELMCLLPGKSIDLSRCVLLGDRLMFNVRRIFENN